MKHTEEQIMTKAKKVLSDLHGEFYNEKHIEEINFYKDENLSRPRGKIESVWIICIHEPLFGGSSVFLTISDETGEPLYIQNKHDVVEIEKNSEEKYI